MNIKPSLMLIATLSIHMPAMAEPDGKQLFVDFGCYQCHGDNAKNTANGLKPLAGMSVDVLINGTTKMLEKRAHADVIKGCGASPTAVEIRKISEYVAQLPQ